MAKNRPLSKVLSAIIVLSLASSGTLPVGATPLAESDPRPAAESAHEQAQGEELYRTQVTLRYPADPDRLEQLGLTLYEVNGGQAITLANREQLATLARRGFHPSTTVGMSTLLKMANDPSLNGSEVTADILALAAPDDDGDGLSNQEEEWWCTDSHDDNSDSPLPPSETNPSDGDEVQAILNGITAYGPPFALWPNFHPYRADGTCPDGDFDGAPDYAEEFIIGTSNLRESSDKDKFDDGQELFGVTFCPASSGPCGYGILPRAEDSAFVSANLPAWVKAPGNSPWVAAFPFPEVEVVPSSTKITAKTTITTDHTITEGEEHTYGTATTKGTSTSLANTVTWNEWEEISHTQEQQLASQDGVVGAGNASGGTGALLAPVALDAGTSVIMEVADCELALLDGSNNCRTIKRLAAIAGNAVNIQDSLIATRDAVFWDPNKDALQNLLHLSKCLPPYGIIQCGAEGYVRFNAELYTRNKARADQQEKVNSSGQVFQLNGPNVTVSPVVNVSYPGFVPTTTTTKGRERGGAQTTTSTQYEEQTISQSSTNQFSESWGTATAIDTAHAADLRFTYNIVNNGTEYAREITSLLFNIYIGDDPNPAYTYNALAPIGTIQNLFPGESLTFTSDPIALTLDEMRAIDEGAPIRIVMEDIAFGQDQAFYQDALNSSVLVALEDGFDDGDQVIDTYLIPVWNPTDTVQDVVKRYFPATEDLNGALLSISTPEFNTAPPTFVEHALTGTSWWNIYMSDGIDYTGAFSSTLAAPNTTVLVRILSDRDLDGYNDRNEIRLETNPDDPASHPNPDLLAGYTSSCDGDNCTALLTFLNQGNYDAYGIEAVMYSPDGLSTITNNTIGGSGRVPAGEQVVLGNTITQPDLTGWTGGAKPFSAGYYLGDTDRVFTFTVPASGFIGVGALNFEWTDGVVTGTVNFGAGYQAPTPQVITEGVQIGFQTGGVKTGESFTVQALTPRDTFQYTRNDPNAAEPVIVVSYNDPQGNHRFILPPQSFISKLQSDLTFLSGQMIPDPGVEIASTSATQAHFIINSPDSASIKDAHLFVEYIDSQGNVDREDVFTQTLETGPTIIPVLVDTAVFTPTEYTLLAFFTDSQGNIIDSSARPLASFGPDPLPIANLAPVTWGFGAVEAGTAVNTQLTLANTGASNLRYALAGLGGGLTVASTAVGSVGPAAMRKFDLTLDTAGLPAGPFARTLTLRTSDPANPSLTINVTGTILAPSGNPFAYAVSPYRPWDQSVYVPGPKDFNQVITFTHTIADEAARTHPLYLYTEDDGTLKGVGEFGPDFTGQTAPFGIFGQGEDGDLLVSPAGGCGAVCYTNNTRTALASTATTGQTQITLADATDFLINKEILIIQMQGTGAGSYQFDIILGKNGNVLTLKDPLSVTFTVGGNSKAQVIQVPHYQNVTIESGGLLTAQPWDGNAGGIIVFRASGTVTVAIGGSIDVSGKGLRGGAGGTPSPTTRPGYQGEGASGIGAQNTNANLDAGGGGGGNTTGGNGGGGGGGHASNGDNGTPGTNSGPGGTGGAPSGDTSTLSTALFGGAGGGGAADDGTIGGAGGNSGGVVLIYSRAFTTNGILSANGANGSPPVNVTGGSGGGAGGGSGGSVVIAGQTIILGTSLVTVLGGNGSLGTLGFFGETGGNGGNGSVGRISLNYGSISGSTNPPANTQHVNFYIIRQLPGSPDNDIELTMPDVISTGTSLRYLAQFGQRSANTSDGDQLFSVRLPNRRYTAVSLSALVERAANSGNAFNFCLDFGNDGVCDWSPAQQNFGGPVRLDTTNTDATALANALNTYIAANGAGQSDLLIPIRVNVDTPADLFLFNLTATPGGDADLQPSAPVFTLPTGMSPDNITQGTLVTLTAAITNTGAHPAENFLVAFYNGDPGAGGALLSSTFVPILAPGATFSAPPVTWNTAGLLGSQTIFVVADGSDNVPEADETNNVLTATATITRIVGLKELVVDAGGSPTDDPAYDSTQGYGWLTQGTVVSACGTSPAETYRQASSVDTIEYRFDDLLPDRFYHLDVTFAVCSGERWVNLFVDGRQAADTNASGLDPIHVTPLPQTVSILIDPAAYSDGSIDLSIQRAQGLGGPVVNLIALREIRYCYRDSGPGEPSWTAENGCGYDPASPSDVFNGWGSAPEQTIRFNEFGPVKYKFTGLEPDRKYYARLTFYEADGEGRRLRLRFDNSTLPFFTLGSTPLHITVQIPVAEYLDGEVVLTIERQDSGQEAIVSEVTLEEITRPLPLKDITFENGSLTHSVSGADSISGTVTLNSASPIKGFFSANIPNTSTTYLQENFTGVDDLFVSFYVRVNSTPSGDVRLAAISNSGITVGNIVLKPNRRLRLFNGATGIGAESDRLTVGAIYRIGIRQRRGTGNNAVLEAYFAVGDVPFGLPFASTTSGRWTTRADRLRIGATQTAVLNATFDDIRLDSAFMPLSTLSGEGVGSTTLYLPLIMH